MCPSTSPQCPHRSGTVLATGEQIASLSPLPARTRWGADAEASTLSFVDPRSGDHEGELDWRRVLGAIVRFKWLILSVTLVGGMARAAATRFMQTEYQAQATVWVDQADRHGEAILQETTYPLFTLIGCGTRVHNAAELLSSPVMVRLIQRARSAYDVILMDSPPLAGGVDPYVLGLAQGTCFWRCARGRATGKRRAPSWRCSVGSRCGYSARS